MADVSGSVARGRLTTADLRVALTAMLAAMIALPLARNSWQGPEVAAVLAVAATAMLAHQRWAIAVVVLAELLLAPALLSRALHGPSDLVVQLAAVGALVALVPGLLAVRRAGVALGQVLGWRHTQQWRRRFHAALIASGMLTAIIPFF